MQRACQRRPVTSYGSSRGPSITITSCLALSYRCSNRRSRGTVHLLVVASPTEYLGHDEPGIDWQRLARVRIGILDGSQQRREPVKESLECVVLPLDAILQLALELIECLEELPPSSQRFVLAHGCHHPQFPMP